VKINFLIFIFIIVLLMVALLFWRRPPRLPSSIQQPQATIQFNTNTTSVNVANQSTPAAERTSAPTKANQPTANKMSLQQAIEKEIEIKNVPIDFYGEAIDQNGNALSGVNIKAAIRHWTLMSPAVVEFGLGSTEIYLEATTGPDGRFELTGASGDVFGLVLAKPGYDAEPGNHSFGAGSYSYANPVIFKMWSTNIHEPLITGNKSFEIIPDGRSYFINLTDGTISESPGEDLRVWIQYTNQVVQGQLYDWSAGMEVINGGLFEVPQNIMNSGFFPDPPFAMYSAPTDGYIPSFSLKSQIKGGQSGEIGNRYFYLLLNGGREYGRMSINLFAPYGYLHPGLVRISYAINPSGSRILR
jgi:hypothetical protein